MLVRHFSFWLGSVSLPRRMESGGTRTKVGRLSQIPNPTEEGNPKSQQNFESYRLQITEYRVQSTGYRLHIQITDHSVTQIRVFGLRRERRTQQNRSAYVVYFLFLFSQVAPALSTTTTS